MIAALSAWHADHEAASRALEEVSALPAHVMLEAYSVLTRLPSGLAVPAADAADVLSRRFAGPPLRLSGAELRDLCGTLAEAEIFGGASYDALVGLEARTHGHDLYSLDRRARETYRRLGVTVRGG